MAGVIAMAATAGAEAQWSVKNLDQGEGSRSQAYGIYGNTQVGEIDIDSVGGHACMWSGTAQSLVDLHPGIFAQSSFALATDGLTQVGYMTLASSVKNAVLWTGSAASYKNLNPAGATGSRAYGVDGNRQVGYVTFPNRQSGAVIWYGSAESYKIITPESYQSASARSIFGDSIGGLGVINGKDRALLWKDDGDVWFDLHPEGHSRDISAVYAVSATQQVGVTRFENQIRAALWSGSAESWVELHPDGAAESVALGGFGGYQVGFARFSDVPHAAIWHGSAESWVDLNDFLPPEYIKSTASGVWTDGHTLYVVGYASTAWMPEAFIWSMPIPAPGAAMPLAFAAMFGARRARRHCAAVAGAMIADAPTLLSRGPTTG